MLFLFQWRELLAVPLAPPLRRRSVDFAELRIDDVCNRTRNRFDAVTADARQQGAAHKSRSCGDRG
jgi:hypothetical protein